ncbi:sulfotransferase 1B1-like [Procambarus clarkii]|uniref:sulfotransferase 1B1-like n=1 Tax=Procambarus clarkii TaxID=6728 RepID=UPI0037422AFE
MEDKEADDSVHMEQVTGPHTAILCNQINGYKEFLHVGPERVFLPSFYANWHSKYGRFPVYQDDVWIVTYPKSGTTWIQEMVWCLMKDPKSPEASHELMKRFPFFEYDSLIPPDSVIPGVSRDDPMQPGMTWRILQELEVPRVIKSHLPKELLPKQFWDVRPKVVYVSRDPRDVCVSFYYHYVKLQGYSGTFDQFVHLFLHDTISYSPIWRHILNFWKMRHEDHILFIRYEDMKQDMSAIVRQVAGFLGQVVDEEQVAWITQHCSFPEMSNNPAVNNETFVSAPTDAAKGLKFMRKGEMGDWRNHLTEAQQKVFKTWTLNNLDGSDFPYYQDYD